MNPRLRALLVAVGLAGVGASGVFVTVFLPSAGVTRAQLLDAGITDDCNAVAIFCTAKFTREGQDISADGGVTVVERYKRIGIPGFRCGNRSDGGVILPPQLRQFAADNTISIVDLDECSMGSCAANPTVCAAIADRVPFVVAPHSHVMAPLDGGLGCQRREPLLDGGSRVRYFGAGNAFPVAEAVGADCVPTVGVVSD